MEYVYYCGGGLDPTTSGIQPPSVLRTRLLKYSVLLNTIGCDKAVTPDKAVTWLDL